MTFKTVIDLKLSYEEALRRQVEFATDAGCGLLLFSCPPTITLGRRASPSDVLVSAARLEQLGIELLRVDRGGQVTYHGPGQLVGFPMGTLEQLTGDSRGVRGMVCWIKKTLKQFIADELKQMGDPRTVDHSACDDDAGVWILDQGVRRKIVSIGLKFEREGVRHGFAFNILPQVLSQGFEWINPCGESKAPPQASLLSTNDTSALREVAARLAGAFELSFDGRL